MRKRIENIEIQEPPLREINKKKSCVRRSCTTGCGCIVLFLIGLLIALKFFLVSSPKNLKEIPKSFPNDIPIYDEDRVSHISFVSGKQKGRVIEMSAYIPKLLLSPFRVILNKDINGDATSDITQGNLSNVGIDDVVNFIHNPTIDQRDIVQIEWDDLLAEPLFIQKYYETQLKKKGYKIKNEKNSSSAYELSFEGRGVDGSVFIKDDVSEDGTDYLSLTVSTPPVQ